MISVSQLENKATSLTNVHDKQYDQLTNAVYRCLLYLGDLSRYNFELSGFCSSSSLDISCRYKELYSENEHKDFTDSVRFYERAALIMPSSGNPHNQVRVFFCF
jgi:hypothetical protein